MICIKSYSVNKKAANYVCNKNAHDASSGNKWSFHALRDYFSQNNLDSDAIFESIHDVIIKTLIATETSINSSIKRFISNKNNVFELFGFGKY